jgi:carboxyl-terminal processing protease
MTGLCAIATDDVAVVGGVVTAATRGAETRTVSSPTTMEVWVRQGKDWCLAASLPLAIRVGLDTTAKGPTVDPKAIEQRIAGKMVGIGVSLDKVETGVRIKEVFPGAPAERAGLHTGDIITAVDGCPTKGLPINQAVSCITGPEGTEVSLGVQGPDGSTRITKMNREAFKSAPVSGRLLNDGVAVVAIPLFYQDASQDFFKQVETLRSQGAAKMVLDLRSCTGGTSDSARAITEMLVPAGKTLWIIQSDAGRSAIVSRRSRSIDLPVVVLVGAKTGGAGELVASALKENGRAALLGQSTSGLARLRQASQRAGGQAELVDIGTILSAANVPITDRGVQPSIQIPGDTAEADVMRRAVEILNKKAQL